MRELKENIVVASVIVSVALIFSVILVVMAIATSIPKHDVPLTDIQILEKSQACPNAVKLIYDEDWNVWAVKCGEYK